LLCCNSDGSEKLKQLVIGKYRKPRCFKNIFSLPCKYVNNNKAWIASKIFINFLKGCKDGGCWEEGPFVCG
jgi:hypothetical protein